MPPVFILHRHRLVSEAITDILLSFFEVEQIDSEGWLNLPSHHRDGRHPEVILVDGFMLGETNGELLRDLKRIWPTARIVAVCDARATGIAELASVDINGWVGMEDDAGTLLAAVTEVASGRQYMSDTVRQLVEAVPSGRPPGCASLVEVAPCN